MLLYSFIATNILFSFTYLHFSLSILLNKILSNRFFSFSSSLFLNCEYTQKHDKKTIKESSGSHSLSCVQKLGFLFLNEEAKEEGNPTLSLAHVITKKNLEAIVIFSNDQAINTHILSSATTLGGNHQNF